MKKKICLFFGALLIVPFYAWAQNVRLGDDFYTFVNQKWLEETKRSVNATQWDNFAVLDSINQKRVRQILENFANDKNLPANSPEKMLGNYYQSGMDTLSIEKQGITPLLPYLARIDAIKDYKDLLKLMAQQKAEGWGNYIGLNIKEDITNSTMYIPTFEQTGARLPSVIFYTSEEEYFVRIQKGYLAFIEKILTLIQESNTKQKALQLFDLEKEIIVTHLSPEDRQDPLKSTNKMSILDFEKLTPNINWRVLLKNEMNLSVDSVDVENLNYFKKLNDLIVNTPIETWKVNMKFLLIIRFIYALPFEFRDTIEELNAVFSGRKVHLPRWERITYQCQGKILNKAYGDKYYSKEVENKLIVIIKNIQKVYEARIENNDWMSKETKTLALKKLKTMKYKLGYSKTTPVVDGLVYMPNQYLQNNINDYAFHFKRAILNLKNQKDKSLWASDIIASEVSAYYDQINNEFILTAGILQAPFFDVKADDAINYGAIACIIAHEMSHAFDNNGRKYDALGNLNDWWKKEDEDKFNALAEKLVTQFNSYKIDTMNINGRLTLGENIADLGAVNVAYHAFLLTEEGKKNTVQNGFTARQRFFISYATMWRIQKHKNALMYSLQTDPHAPNKYRVNGVLSNFTPFYEAFRITEKDKMFKPQKERVTIW